jgi:hypothetical protein
MFSVLPHCLHLRHRFHPYHHVEKRSETMPLVTQNLYKFYNFWLLILCSDKISSEQFLPDFYAFLSTKT